MTAMIAKATIANNTRKPFALGFRMHQEMPSFILGSYPHSLIIR
jgi:hypothetical protein